MPAHETYTLRDMSDDTLRVLERRRNIACVLVNPLQALHPNTNAPADSSLIDSARKAHFDRKAYTEWLHRLRTVCTRRKIVLIFDEVFVGFRLDIRGAQEYFGVPADLVTYGKTLGGGLPIGVVCGRKDLMKRFQDDRPTDVCFARGHVQLPSLRDGRYVRVPGASRHAADARALPRPRSDLGREGTAAQRAPAARRLAGAGSKHVLDLDGVLHAAIALQLDAAVLSPCSRAWR